MPSVSPQFPCSAGSHFQKSFKPADYNLDPGEKLNCTKAIQLEAELQQKEGQVELEIPQREGFIAIMMIAVVATGLRTVTIY